MKNITIAALALLTGCTPASYATGHFECAEGVLLGQSCVSTAALYAVAVAVFNMWLLWRLVSFMGVVETRLASIDEHVEKTRRHLERLGD